MSTEKKCVYASTIAALIDDVVNTNEPSAERATMLLLTLLNESKKDDYPITISIVESTKIGKVLADCVRSCRRHKRSSDNQAQWDTVIEMAESLVKKCADAYEQKSTPTATSSRCAEETSSESPSLSSQVKKKIKKTVGDISSIFRKNTADNEDGNNNPTHADKTPNSKNNNEIAIEGLMEMPSYSHTPPKQPTQEEIDSLPWITVEQVDDSFNAVSIGTQKRAKGAQLAPPVLAFIVDKETALGLRLCTTMKYTDGIREYNQKHMSLWGTLPCNHNELTVAAIETNNNEVWHNFLVYFYNREEDVPDIQWHPNREARLAELIEDSKEKSNANKATSRVAAGFLVYEANDDRTGPKSNPLTSVVNFSDKTNNGNSGLRCLPEKGGFGAMKVKGTNVKAPGAQGMLYKEFLWVKPCNDEQRAEAKANENAERIQVLINEKLYPGKGKVWVSNPGK